MKKIISNKYLDITPEEFEYYQTLEKSLGPNPLTGMFKSNSDGLITAITLDPNKPQAMISIFFLLNLRFNQALRKFAEKVEKIENLEKKILELEDKIEKS